LLYHMIMTSYTPVIGLEIHVQLKTKSKMFGRSPVETGNVEPNTNIDEVDTGQPGTLPTINKAALEKAILFGLALNCEIAEYSKFDRKNYFYPDLPKGYQISQFDQPICGKGKVSFEFEGSKVDIGITRAHLEEDAGKLLHPAGADYSLVDLNRAGTPLLEVVTEPDFTTPAQARAFLQHLRRLARYLGVSDADMEKGHLRCDANISLRKSGEKGLPGYKVEIKNMNSFKAVEEALLYEIDRQTEELAEGKKIPTQTRGWVAAKRETVAQRQKEGSDDYRYFPDPDLPVLHFTKKDVEAIKRKMPELPDQKLERFTKHYELSEKIALHLIDNKSLAGYFEGVVSDLQSWLKVEKMDDEKTLNKFVTEAANWVTGPFTELLKETGITASESKVSGENFAELIKMIENGEISKTAAKEVLGEMFITGADPSNVVEDKGLGQMSDTGALEKIVDKILAENPEVVEDVKAGKKQAAGFLVGKIMAATGGKANPKMVSEILEKRIGK